MTSAKYRLFGIPNCDTVKKVRVALEKKKIVYDFIDFKKAPPTKQDIERWKAFMGDWPVNAKGPTFRKISEAFKAASSEKKIKLLIENSSAIKRPILEKDGKVEVVGFNSDFYGN